MQLQDVIYKRPIVGRKLRKYTVMRLSLSIEGLLG